MDWLQFAVQWAHVFLGIFWFGATLYADFVLIPALSTLPLGVQRQVGSAIGTRANKLIPAIAGAVILLGIVRGTVFGPIQNLNALTSNYGITWLVALAVAFGTFIYGLRVLVPAIERLSTVPEAEAMTPDGQPSPKLAALIDDVKRKVGLELIGFVVILTCMILMRFGQ